MHVLKGPWELFTWQAKQSKIMFFFMKGAHMNFFLILHFLTFEQFWTVWQTCFARKTGIFFDKICIFFWQSLAFKLKFYTFYTDPSAAPNKNHFKKVCNFVCQRWVFCLANLSAFWLRTVNFAPKTGCFWKNLIFFWQSMRTQNANFTFFYLILWWHKTRQKRFQQNLPLWLLELFLQADFHHFGTKMVFFWLNQ